MRTVTEIWTYCQDAANGIYESHAPTPEYALRVARMTFGTVMHENGGLQWRRQLLFGSASTGNLGGAFGLGQVERATLRAMLERMNRLPGLRHHFREYVGDVEVAACLTVDNTDALCRWLENEPYDRLAVGLARLRYLSVTMAIPFVLRDQALYWLTFYNGRGACKKYLRQGKFEPESQRLALAEYMASWRQWCEPVLG